MSLTVRVRDRTAPRSDAVAGKRNPNTRYDLQGMRGIGVIGVVLGHLYLKPEGMFALLDVFFVLSGFVITMVLLDIDQKYGRVLFVPFYLARARRLLPMGLFVTGVTVALGYVVFNRQKADLIAEDGFFSTIFWANWHFAGQEDYFASQHQSPFLHYWSLSVEEQFYTVWPLFLFVTLLAVRRLRRSRYALAAVMAVFAVGFFLYSLWHSAESPAVAYFSTFDRAWQFAAGGVLAALRPELARIPGAVAKPLGWIGLNSLWIPIFLLSPSYPFPAPWGLLPVASTLAVIAAGVGRDTRYLWMVDNRALRYVGDISYSVYLWHLPAIVLLAPFFESRRLYELTVLLATAVLSVVFFHLLEKPARFAPFLMTPPERRRARQRSRDSATSLKIGWTGVLAASAAVLMVLALNYGKGEDVESGPLVARPTVAPTTTAERLEQVRADLGAALDATQFPEFSVPLDDLGTNAWRQQLARVACATNTADPERNCSFGSTAPDAPLMVVIGDSLAAALTPGLLANQPAGWRIIQLSNGWCGTWTLPSYRDPQTRKYPICETWNAERDELLERLRPDVVLLASSADHVRNAERTDLGREYTGREIAEEGLGVTLERYGQWADRIVVVSPRPRTPALVDCVTRVGSPEDCVGTLDARWQDHHDGEKAAAEAAGATYVEASDWFCVDGRCPGWANGIPTSVDGTHLSVEYSRVVGPLLVAAIFGEAALG